MPNNISYIKFIGFKRRKSVTITYLVSQSISLRATSQTGHAPATPPLLATLARSQARLDQGPYAAHCKHAQLTALAGYAGAIRT